MRSDRCCTAGYIGPYHPLGDRPGIPPFTPATTDSFFLKEYLLERELMRPDDTKHDNKPNTNASKAFHRFQGGVVVSIPCNLCDNQTLFINDIYTLLDFKDNGGVVEHAVKFFDAFHEGYIVTVVVLDLKTGELLKRKHRINNEHFPCDWLLMDTEYLDPKDRRDDLLAFDF